jgi:hypothetical protein
MSIPNMTDALAGLGDPLTVAVIAKSTQEFEAQETITRFQTVYGVQVPTQPRELALLPEGERNWRFITFYTDDTTLKNDYYVQTDDKTQFRILATEPWGAFNKYTLQECPRAGSAGEPPENLAAEAGA